VSRSCLKCLTNADYICLKCGGCPDCCKCDQLQQEEGWVHIASREGAMKRNAELRKMLPTNPVRNPTGGA
jgi:hypothetical protein